MANTLKIKRGLAASIPQGQLAEPLFTTDTYDLYIGKGAGGNQRIQNYIASGTSSQFLKGDGSLDSTTYQATSEKGQNNGYASLDAGGKIPAAQLPSSVIEYKGTWNASTNTPTLADGTGDAGDVYIVSVGGTQNLGSGSITFDAGDWIMYNGSVWQKSTGSNAVASVNGQTGIVVLDTDDISEPVSATNLWFTNARARAAISLTTTGTSGAATYDNSTGVLNIPQYQAVLTNPVTGTGTNNEIAYFNTTGSTIASLSTATYPSLTELSYVKGVTSAIQTQLNAKEPTVTKGNLTETTSSVLTITGGTGAVIGSGTTIAVASAGASQAGVVTTGTQTIAGSKTFSSSPTMPALFLTNMTAGSGALYYNTGENRLTLANYNASGILMFEVNGGAYAMAINADKSIRMHGYTTNGFVKFSNSDGTLIVDTNTYLTTSSAASTYVPYTGATTNVNIGTNSMTAFNFYASSTFYVDSNNYFMKSILELRDNATSTKRIYITADTSESLISTVNTVPLKLRATSGVTEQVVLNTNGTISFTGAATFSSSVQSGTYLRATGGTGAASGKGVEIGYESGDFGTIIAYDRTAGSFKRLSLNDNLHITSGGNVGIGTTNPTGAAGLAFVLNSGASQGRICIKTSSTGDASGDGLQIGMSGNDAFIEQRENADLTFATNASERMRITSGGNVGIGTTSPAQALHVLGGASPVVIASNSSVNLFTEYRYNTSTTVGYIGNGTGIVTGGSSGDFGVRAESSLIFCAGGNAERMRITSGGYLKASTTGSYINPSNYHELTSNANDPTLYLLNHAGGGNGLLVNLNTDGTTYNFFRGYSNSAGANRIIIYSNGNIQNTNNSYGSLSDIKIKENIVDATPKLSDILKVKIKNFNFIGNNTKQIGVIAQELEEIFPSMIDETPDTDADGNYLGTKTKSVKYSVFVPMLIKAIQEQQAQIEELKSKLN